MRVAFRARMTAVFVLTLALCTVEARGQTVTWAVQYLQPELYPEYQPQLTSHLVAAGNRWMDFLRSTAPNDVTINIRVDFNNNFPRATGRSTTTSYVATRNGFNIWEQGVAALIRTGNDVNGATHDVEITMNTDYMMNNLWFDPDPIARTAVVPNNRTDAMSVMLHELGHAIGFNGWSSHTTGAPPTGANYKSTWDEHMTFDGANIFFDGPRSTEVYGGPVPVTYGNNYHIGNSSPRPGSDVIPDLMNGVVFFYGTRYDVSALDVAILEDTGLTPVPEPGLLGVIAFAAIAAWARRHAKRDCYGSRPQ